MPVVNGPLSSHFLSILNSQLISILSFDFFSWNIIYLITVDWIVHVELRSALGELIN